MTRPDFQARALVAGTVGVGAVLLGVAALETRGVPLGMLVLLGAAALLTELIVVPQDESSFDPRDRTAFTFSASVHIAAVLLLGPWAAALVAAFGVLVADGLSGTPLRKLAFNASASALAAGAAGGAFLLGGGEVGRIDLPADFLAIGLTAVTLYSVGALLVSTVVALAGGMPLCPAVREGFVGGLASSVCEAGLGLALAAFAEAEPWAAAALFPLVAAVYRSHERLVTLRRETANALETFANVVDERDPHTYRHSARVAEHVRSLAEALELPPRAVAQLRWAGRLHDLGKISVDAAILRKPGKLEGEEWTAMRLHPRLSARLLRRFRFAGEQAKAVEYHHERFDGTGYYGIASAEIPLAAHFLVVADSFDAMTSDRPYRAGLAEEVALAEIERNTGSQFHPGVAKAFVALRRGEDPRAVLTPAERAELRRLGSARPRLDVRRVLAPRPELLGAGGVAASLLAVGAGHPSLALPGLAVALAGVGLHAWTRLRARRLLAGLRRAAEAEVPADVLTGLVGELSRACPLRWAGVVRWRERECVGVLELECGDGTTLGPSQEGLTSWLVREAEAATGPLVAPGFELGRRDPHLVLPLRRGPALDGYLVLAVSKRVPRPVEEALAESAEA
ncbi:MAG: HD-GYP domain-containing protein, partial [Gaiellaceae bacterium]